MKAKPFRPGWVLALLLVPTLAGAQWQEAGELPDEDAGTMLPAPVDGEQQLQHRLREARARLEQAVREVGELSARLAMQYDMVAPADPGRTLAGSLAGRVTPPPRAMLGIIVSRPGDERADDGVQVDGVTPGGPADEAGVQVGDLIVGINGEPLGGEGSPGAEPRLVQRMQAVDPGDTVSVTVRRNGRELELSLVTRESAPPATAAAPSESGARLMVGGTPQPAGDAVAGWRGVRPFPPVWQPWADMELAELSEELGRYFSADNGILVVRAPRDRSLALRDGDVILSIGGREPGSVAHALRILTSYVGGETLPLQIMRDHRREELSVQLPARPVGGTRLLLDAPGSDAATPADRPGGG